ncbi:MAG: response regulator [Treponema sp.]|jgi:signal transduction histidine kinase/HPt (histidine-containing phosphotransfer) domain-containing protein/ActR/RegA family two-component response regulator|nr:response regulator [Treponema sp.]
MIQAVFFISSSVLSIFVLYTLSFIWFSDFRNRRLTSFFIMWLDVCLWTLLNGMSVIVAENYFSLLYYLRMIPVCILPYSLLWFFLSYSGSKLAESKPAQWIAIVIPALDILALLTNPLHKLYFEDFEALIPNRGVLFWIHTGFSYFAILIGVIRFFVYLFRITKKNRMVLFTGICILIPWAVNITLTFLVQIYPYRNPTPIVFCFSFFVFFFVSYKSHFFSFKTLALAGLFETYPDAIVLMGKDGFIRDFNNKFVACFPSFTAVLGETSAADFIRYLGEEARDTVPEILPESPDPAFFAGGEFTITDDGKKLTYHCSLQRFKGGVWGQRRSPIDYSVTFRDITEEKKQSRRLVELKVAAETASEAKSSFLANTSHEIRTPLNVILGITELILRKNIPLDIYEDAVNIKQAGNNLLAIINDILDISKIEAGKMEISPQDYRFTTLINECISIIRVRISDKRIRFITNIDSRIPEELTGDMVRIRQILLNLLNNAVKYTREGYIKLTIHCEAPSKIQKNAQEVKLIFRVEDTGVGIKPEDLTHVFDNFVRLDSHRDRAIEGTGLGLPISRNLIRLMGGDITLESVYGEGTVFTAKLPQKVRNNSIIAQVEKPELKPVLLYERRAIYGESVFYTLQNLGVFATIVESEKIREELLTKKWAYIFVSPDVGEWVLNFIKENSLETIMVLLAKLEEMTIYKYTPKIMIPTYTTPIANVLNGVVENKPHKDTGIRFTAKDAKVLVVDDIDTNLIVARGFLEAYQMEVHTCNSGKKAIKLIQESRYDMIFMDHMMPEMDGIETAAIIRTMDGDYYRNVPIIALTANAVVGMKDMFLERNFNDFISKPIGLQQLDEMLIKWIPKDKRQIEKPAPITMSAWEVNAEAGTQETSNDEWDELTEAGVNVKTGLSFTGGTAAGYFKVLAVFLRDAEERLNLLEQVPDESARHLFVTCVHALKSAAASIGADAVSKQAMELENAGNLKDTGVLENKLPLFRQSLGLLIDAIRRTLKTHAGTAGEKNPELLVLHLSRFRELREALEQEEPTLIDHLLGELGKIPFDGETSAVLSDVSDAVLLCEYGLAIERIDGLVKEP